MPYLLLKALHVFAVVIFLGNIITGLATTWELWGAIALLSPAAALLIMTLKPAW